MAGREGGRAGLDIESLSVSSHLVRLAEVMEEVVISCNQKKSIRDLCVWLCVGQTVTSITICLSVIICLCSRGDDMVVSPRPPLETFLTVFRQRPSYINLTMVLHFTPQPHTNTGIKYERYEIELSTV